MKPVAGLSAPPNPNSLQHFPQLDGKTMLLGIGAMKCGTSWWNKYLGTYDNVMCSPLKEVHYFDSLFVPEGHRETTNPRIMARLNTHLNRSDSPVNDLQKRPHFRATVDRIKMIYDPNAYFAHFAGLVYPKHQFFSETTPAYAILPPEGMQLIKDMAASQNIKLKVVFLMRDPVDRMWSHLRFMQERNPANDVLSNWREMLANPRVTERGDYQHTIEAVSSVFDDDQAHFVFYEDIREEDQISKFANSLGLTHTKENQLGMVNETSVKLEMTAEIEAAISELLAPQYAFCRDFFGDKLSQHWR